MADIVRKLETRVAPTPTEGVPSSLREHQDRQLEVRVNAHTVDGMKKEAVVHLESPVGSTWSIQCDEGAYLGGEDSAPPSLVYFSAAIAF